MEEIIYNIDNWSIVKLLGGLTLVLTSILGIFWVFVFEKIKQNWKNQSNNEVEALKAELSKQNTTLNSLQSNQILHLQKYQDKKVEAVTKLWNAATDLRKSIPSEIALYLSILTDDEINQQNFERKNSQGGCLGDRIAHLDEFNITKFIEPSRIIDYYKPFMSYELYRTYKFYVAIIGRVTFGMINNYKTGTLKNWKEDERMISLSDGILSKDELTHINSIKSNSFNILLDLVQIKIENLIRYTLTGQDTKEDTIDQLKEIEKLMKINQIEKKS